MHLLAKPFASLAFRFLHYKNNKFNHFYDISSTNTQNNCELIRTKLFRMGFEWTQSARSTKMYLYLENRSCDMFILSSLSSPVFLSLSVGINDPADQSVLVTCCCSRRQFYGQMNIGSTRPGRIRLSFLWILFYYFPCCNFVDIGVSLFTLPFLPPYFLFIPFPPILLQYTVV